jgi:hypothetical protein
MQLHKQTAGAKAQRQSLDYALFFTSSNYQQRAGILTFFSRQGHQASTMAVKTT